MKTLSKIIIFIALIGGLYAIFSNKSATLPSYQVDMSQTSTSGLSSGAYMAEQFQVAHSRIVVGVGIIAGGPYYCAGSFSYVPFVTTALTTCMNPSLLFPDGEALAKKANAFAESGEIDATANLKRDKVYLFSGAQDSLVATRVVDQAAVFYKAIGVPAENIKYVKDVNAGHAILTDNQNDGTCTSTASPYIDNCHFMQSHDILKQIYGNLNPPASVRSGKVIAFDQSEFDHSFFSSMAKTGYAYIPKSCATTQCRVHIVFHGCAQSADDIGDRFYETTGYNELADANRIIVLYPQLKRSSFLPANPMGCWDFWGYSGYNPLSPNFYNKQAPQISAVKAMLDRLGEARTK
jgi:poly(3-hydroxybutyrate) depolymerase